MSCSYCLKASAKLSRCGRCRVAAYCSKECQKEHWKKHKQHCKSAAKANTAVTTTPKSVGPVCCFICLETGDPATPLLPTGCGCRGDAAYIHEVCATKAAVASVQRSQGRSWAGWQLCPTCKQRYTGALKLALAREWCRRTEASPDDTKLQDEAFAARTSLGNALSEASRVNEAIEACSHCIPSSDDEIF